MSHLPKLFVALLLISTIVWIVFARGDGVAMAPVGVPEAPTSAGDPSLKDGSPSVALVRENARESLGVALIVVDGITNDGLSAAWISRNGVVIRMSDVNGGVVEAASPGQEWIVTCPGYLSKPCNLVAGLQVVRLDRTVIVHGFIRTRAGLPPPAPERLRVLLFGIASHGRERISQKLKLDAMSEFRFDSGDSSKITVEVVCIDGGDRLGWTTWSYGDPTVIVELDRLPSELGPQRERVIDVSLGGAFVAWWKARAAKGSLNRMILEYGRSVDRIGGAGLRSIQDNQSSGTIGETNIAFKAPLTSGEWDFALRDLVTSTVYSWHGVGVRDEDGVIRLLLPTRGSIQFEFSGVKPSEVSVRQYPTALEVFREDGSRVATYYPDDGSVVGGAENVPAGNYFAIGFGRSPEHRWLRSRPVRFSVTDGSVAIVQVALEPAQFVRVTAGLSPQSHYEGQLSSLDGGLVQSFSIESGAAWSYPVPSGWYELTFADADGRMGRRECFVAADAKTVITIP